MPKRRNPKVCIASNTGMHVWVPAAICLIGLNAWGMFLPETARGQATNEQVSTGVSLDTATDENFTPVWNRLQNMFGVYDQNAWQPIVKQQFMLNAARAMYELAGQNPPGLLRTSAAECSSDDEMQKWLASHWEKLQLDSRNKTAEQPTIDYFCNLVAAALPGTAEYESPKSNRVSQQLAENRYVGIGIRVRRVDGLVMIDEPFPGGAAAIAGARSGDLILEVDGESMRGKSFAKVIDILRGPEGTDISVVVQHQDEDSSRQLDMVRTVIPIPSVQGVAQNKDGSWNFTTERQPEVGLLRIAQIVGSTSAELRDAASQLIEAGAEGVVLDLSFLRSADLHQVNMVADVLAELDDWGTVVSAAGTKRTLVAEAASDFQDLPIAVLTPGGDVDGAVMALLMALKRRPHTRMFGRDVASDLYCRGSFQLEENQGALANVVNAKLVFSSLTSSGSVDLSGHLQPGSRRRVSIPADETGGDGSAEANYAAAVKWINDNR